MLCSYWPYLVCHAGQTVTFGSFFFLIFASFLSSFLTFSGIFSVCIARGEQIHLLKLSFPTVFMHSESEREKESSWHKNFAAFSHCFRPYLGVHVQSIRVTFYQRRNFYSKMNQMDNKRCVMSYVSCKQFLPVCIIIIIRHRTT